MAYTLTAYLLSGGEKGKFLTATVLYGRQTNLYVQYLDNHRKLFLSSIDDHGGQEVKICYL
jgi:hypothetical protein